MTKGVIGVPNTLSTVDSCGQRVLGMSGSLSAYINTGNQYDKDYYVIPNSLSLLCLCCFPGPTALNSVRQPQIYIS